MERGPSTHCIKLLSIPIQGVVVSFARYPLLLALESFILNAPHLGHLTPAEKLLAAQTTGDHVSFFRLEAPGNPTGLVLALESYVGR